MKILMCSLAAILTVALGSGTLAAAEEAVVTGIVEDVSKGILTINQGNERRPNFYPSILLRGLKPPKEGEKVRVHGYYIHGGMAEFVATKIEKVGNAEGGSKKR